MAGKKNNRVYNTVWPPKPAQESSTRNNGLNASGNCWATQPTSHPAKAPKTSDPEFPSLADTTTASTSSKKPPSKARNNSKSPSLASTTTSVSSNHEPPPNARKMANTKSLLLKSTITAVPDENNPPPRPRKTRKFKSPSLAGTTSAATGNEKPSQKARKAWNSKSPSLRDVSTVVTSNNNPQPKARKTFDFEFPPLAGTAITVTSNKDNWVSPDELQDPNEWRTGVVRDQWKLGEGDKGLPSDYFVGPAAAKNSQDNSVESPTRMSWDSSPVETAEMLQKKEIEKRCMGWPWNKVPLDQLKVITLAPYRLNEHGPNPRSALKNPYVEQTSPFFTILMRTNDVAFLVLKYVFKYHSSAWQLAATCQELWDLISRNVEVWDMTSGYFNNCDKLGKPHDPLTASPTPGHDSFTIGSVSAHLIVSPFRRTEGPASYLEQVRSLRGLCISVYNFGHSLRNIHFHRVPFLNINVLALLIPQMTKLEDLGIFNCRLMHLGTGLRLLDLLTIDRMKGKEHSVSLDFYPNYHLGPEETGHYGVGTYGVCWDNLNFDTCMGIWSLTKRIVMKARKQGIDLESPHTMFRRWLEKTPCWAVGDTLRSFFDPKMKPNQVAAMVQYRFSHGHASRLTSIQGYTHDLNWWGRDVRCDTCGDAQMGVFFSIPNAYISQGGRYQHPDCYGCRLTWQLRREQDHYKTEKRKIVRAWLKDPTVTEADESAWNTTDLGKAIEDYTRRGIENLAANLDEIRHHQMTHGSKVPDGATFGTDPYDKETQERQRPYTQRELNGRRGTRLRSPDVVLSKAEEKAWLEDPIKGEYKWCTQAWDKYDGHGHIY